MPDYSGAGAEYQVPNASVSTSGDSWLDLVPGARSAYNYVVEKLSEFHLVGLQKLPGYEALLTTIGPRVRGTNDPVLNNLLTTAEQQTNALRAKWSELEPKVRGAVAQFQSAGLGALPLAALLAIAATLAAIATGMYFFFSADAQNEDTIRQLVERSVIAGLISESDAARILRQGSGGGLGALGGGLTTIALVAAAIYFLPRRRNA